MQNIGAVKNSLVQLSCARAFAVLDPVLMCSVDPVLMCSVDPVLMCSGTRPCSVLMCCGAPGSVGRFSSSHGIQPANGPPHYPPIHCNITNQPSALPHLI